MAIDPIDENEIEERIGACAFLIMFIFVVGFLAGFIFKAYFIIGWNAF